MGGQRLENVIAGSLAGDKVAAFAKSQQHVEKAVIGNGIMLASVVRTRMPPSGKMPLFTAALRTTSTTSAMSMRPSRLAEYSIVKCGMGDHSSLAPTEPQPPPFAKFPTPGWYRAGEDSQQ
jgi:hypothetical protein